MNRKKILFIGAGKFQLQGIIKAKEMGLFVIAVDKDPQAPGFKYAHKSYIKDVTDYKSNLNIAKTNSIDGVLTIASDICVKTVAYISQTLNLPGINLSVAEKSTDKELMRKSFATNHIPSPISHPVFSFNELVSQAHKIGFPVVVKPADNAGSRGVQKISRPEDLKQAYQQAIKYSKKQKIIVEDFMDGVESSVEAFVYGGKINIIALSDKIRTKPPFLLDTTVIFPSRYSNKIQKEMIKIAKNAIKAVGITTGPVHLEMMMTKKGPVPVELASRGPGSKVFTDILPTITGIDLLKETIITVLGDKPILTRKKNLSSVLKLLDGKAGKVVEIANIEKARNIPGIYELEIYVKLGDTVRQLTCGDDRIGHIISFAKTREEAIKIIKKAESIIKIEIA